MFAVVSVFRLPPMVFCLLLVKGSLLALPLSRRTLSTARRHPSFILWSLRCEDSHSVRSSSSSSPFSTSAFSQQAFSFSSSLRESSSQSGFFPIVLLTFYCPPRFRLTCHYYYRLRADAWLLVTTFAILGFLWFVFVFKCCWLWWLWCILAAFSCLFFFFFSSDCSMRRRYQEKPS